MGSPFKHEMIKKIRRKIGIDSLDSRERKIMLGGILFVLCFLVIQFAVVPFWDARNNLEISIQRKSEELVKIKQLQDEYMRLRVQEGGIRTKIMERTPGFTLFTYLDKQVTKADVKKQIKYMKPSTQEGDDDLNESMVEIKLQRTTLKDLVSFLLLVESEKNVVSISRISIQDSGNEQGYLDVIMQIRTFELKG